MFFFLGTCLSQKYPCEWFTLQLQADPYRILRKFNFVPPLIDEFVEIIAEKFENVEDFGAKLKGGRVS